MSVKYDDLFKEVSELGILYAPGQGGIRLTKTTRGAILQNLNKDGLPIRFSKFQVNWLVQRFPELMDVLSRNMETMRRVQGLRARLSAFLGGSFSDETAPKNAKSTGPASADTADSQGGKASPKSTRKYDFIESLDPDANRKVPKSLEELKELSVKTPEKLPRSFTVVDVTDPEKPVRTIFQIEFDVGGLRTDEAMISYTVSAAEMELLKKGKSFAGDIRDMATANLRVFYSDINGPISGETLLEHHKKTLKTLGAVAQKFFDTYRAKVKGAATFATKEVHLQSMHANVSDGIAAVGRAIPESARDAVDKATTTCVKLEPTTVGGKTILNPVYEATGMDGLRKLSTAQLDEFMRLMGEVGERLVLAAKKGI